MEEVAVRAQMDVEEVRRVLDIGRHPVSLDRPVGEGDDCSFGEFIEDTQTDNPVRCYVPLKLAPPLTNMTALLGGDEEGNACLPHPLVTALSSARWVLYRHRPPTVIA